MEISVEIISWYLIGLLAFIIRMVIAFFALFAFHKTRPGMQPFIENICVPVFLLFDWLLNIYMIPFFMEFPKNWKEVVSNRLARYRYSGEYRSKGILNRWRRLNGKVWCAVLSKADKQHCYNNWL